MKNLDWAKLDLIFLWMPLVLLFVCLLVSRAIEKKYYLVTKKWGMNHFEYQGTFRVIPIVFRLLQYLILLFMFIACGYLLLFKFFFFHAR